MSIGREIRFEPSDTTDPQTGRLVRRFTSGAANHYPLYYFVPSHTRDGRSLVIHREEGGVVQLHRLDLETGVLTQLTEGRSPQAGWAIWCLADLAGVYNHLSALNRTNDELWYFQDEAGGRIAGTMPYPPEVTELRAVNVQTLAQRVILRLPGRLPMGQASFSPDGRTFAFLHADALTYPAAISARETGGSWRIHEEWRRRTPVTLTLVDTQTEATRELVSLDYHAHHVNFVDNEHVLVNHCRDGNGMWVMNISGDPATEKTLRPADDHGRVCHQLVTARGIYYEAFRAGAGGNFNWIGRYDWPADRWNEVPLETGGYAHTGSDPAGRFLFFEVAGKEHALYALRYPRDGARRRLELIRTLAAYPRPKKTGSCQMHHAHPFLSPLADADQRRWLWHTEVVDGYSQVAAVDAGDLTDRDEYWDAP